MIRNILSTLDVLIFGHVDYEMVSHYSLADSVLRVKDVVTPWGWKLLGVFKSGLYGAVTTRSVVVSRELIFVHNSFKPIFYGSFESGSAGLRLSGAFTQHRFVKAFMTFWLSGAALSFVFGLVELPAALRTHEQFWWMFFLLLPMGLVMIRLGNWMSRGDIQIIADALDRALS
jgi:hypothetical protein